MKVESPLPPTNMLRFITKFILTVRFVQFLHVTVPDDSNSILMTSTDAGDWPVVCNWLNHLYKIDQNKYYTICKGTTYLCRR